MQLACYYDPLDADELAFLRRKEERSRKQMYRMAKLAMIICFIIPFGMAWLNAFDKDVQNPFSYRRYFLGVLFLIALSAAGLYWVYTRYLKKLQLDIRSGVKTVEPTHITSKKYIPHNDSYHFYIASTFKMSIEVYKKDFYRLNEGDEVNIEYTTLTKMYLGYF